MMNEKGYPVLPKWPFVAGDILLLGLATLIAILSPKPYSTIATSCIIIAGTLAALLLLAPFIVEYLTHMQMTNRNLQASVDQYSARSKQILDELGGIVLTLSSVLEKSAQPAEDLRESATALQKPLTGVDEGEARALQKKELDVVQSIAELRKAQEHKLQGLTSLLRSIHKEVSVLSEKSATSTQDSERRLESLVDKFDALLQTAIAEPLESPPLAEKDLDVVGEEESEIEMADDADPVVIDDAPAIEVAAAIEESEIVQNVPAEPLEEIPEDDFGEKSPLEPETPALSRSAAEDPASLTLISNLNIGIGNTPYVRGEGLGLSWNKGIPMSFVEIGKWEWKVENADESAWVQIFKNDEISAYGNDIEIGVGEVVETYLEFPNSPDPKNVDLDK